MPPTRTATPSTTTSPPELDDEDWDEPDVDEAQEWEVYDPDC